MPPSQGPLPPSPSTAFVLGAGLGTRLRPLTDLLPKPLIPVAHQPLIVHAFDHLRSAGVGSFVVNTHHLAEAYTDAFPDSSWQSLPIAFRNEPVLLETAGGIVNVADLLPEEAFWVYNGDILSTFDLAPAWESHIQSDAEITLILRSQGPSPHIAFDPETGLVRDIRGLVHSIPGTHQFTGVYLVSRRFVSRLTPGKKESVIPHFLDIIRERGALHAVVADDGYWLDLGDPASYLSAHEQIARGTLTPPMAGARVSADAEIDDTAFVDSLSFVGAGARIGANSKVIHSVIWPNATLPAGSIVENHIVLPPCLMVPGEHPVVA